MASAVSGICAAVHSFSTSNSCGHTGRARSDPRRGGAGWQDLGELESARAEALEASRKRATAAPDAAVLQARLIEAATFDDVPLSAAQQLELERQAALEVLSIARDVIPRCGTGEHDADQLAQLLAGNTAKVSFGADSLRAESSPEDLETMLQLLHLHWRAPRRDDALIERRLSARQGMLGGRGAADLGAARPTGTEAGRMEGHSAHPRPLQ